MEWAKSFHFLPLWDFSMFHWWSGVPFQFRAKLILAMSSAAPLAACFLGSQQNFFSSYWPPSWSPWVTFLPFLLFTNIIKNPFLQPLTTQWTQSVVSTGIPKNIFMQSKSPFTFNLSTLPTGYRVISHTRRITLTTYPRSTFHKLICRGAGSGTFLSMVHFRIIVLKCFSIKKLKESRWYWY